MHTLPLPLAAFVAGILSFLSPCVLPLVPGYVSLISGTGIESLQDADASLMRRVMLNSLMFILGFSIVFISLGAVATGLGQAMHEYHAIFAKVAGVVLIIFGLHLIGVLKIKALYADKRIHSLKGSASPIGSFVVGFAFAFGWTPCIGPILAGILVLAGSQDTVAKGILLLAQSNYEVQFASESRVSERVIFPTSPSQSNGIEDARFVLFRNEDGTQHYYATYTAFDGKLILPQLLETPDFLHFRFITLNGPAVQNKGMALFPRKLNGSYAMISRQDNENIYLMYSDNIHFWYDAELVLKPTFPWEFVQLGNCGSPMEIDEGWLVLSHGVGPMRKYCIGAFLLDLQDPTKVIGRLREPLLKPTETEREGYVPNVVYSCGALIHNGELVLPYAMSDYATNFATVSVKDLLAAMV